jgi:hypothetical protein
VLAYIEGVEARGGREPADGYLQRRWTNARNHPVALNDDTLPGCSATLSDEVVEDVIV